MTDTKTCAQIVNNGWQTSDYAVMVNGENFPDALSASVLAKKYDAPILLTESNNLNNNAKSQLDRLKVKKVFIVGGSYAVTNENSIEDSFNINVNLIGK